jgi:hypothetical protein
MTLLVGIGLFVAGYMLGFAVAALCAAARGD